MTGGFYKRGCEVKTLFPSRERDSFSDVQAGGPQIVEWILGAAPSGFGFSRVRV